MKIADFGFARIFLGRVGDREGQGSKQSPVGGMSRVGCYVARIVGSGFVTVIVAASRGFWVEK